MAATSQISSSYSQNEALVAASSTDGNELIGGDLLVQKTDEYQSPGDEENIQQRVVGPENHSASDEQGAGQVVSTTETNLSVPILEA
jgi:hypothetical protein